MKNILYTEIKRIRTLLPTFIGLILYIPVIQSIKILKMEGPLTARVGTI